MREKIGVSVASLSVWLLLAGCQTLGPAALGVGRGAYNDIIARTGSEQTLGLIVRLRYSDPIGLLMVSSVTAGLKFHADVKGEAGFGPRANYTGNLVPFSAGIGYEDSPTISYSPVDAQAFLREWLMPTTMETLALVLQSAARQDALIVMLVERLNGVRSGAGAPVEERAAFRRAATLLSEFRERGMASWGQQSGVAGRYELILSHYSPAHVGEVEEFLRLLDLHGDPVHQSMIRIPVIVGVQDGNFDGIALQTRSVAEIMLNAAESIDVPREHVEEGLVEASADSSALAVPLPTLRIHSSRNAPARANVAVEHRGWWYYVDDADLVSKRTFLQIQTLFLTRLSEATRGTQATPVLTIPVK